MSQAELRDRVRAYLQSQHVMTLATAAADGPWAAAVFFAGDEDGLVFLSSPSSRHARALHEQPRVAATVQADCAHWAEIKGVQIEGLARVLQGEDKALAQELYARKFPLVASAAAPLAIAQALARVHWYRLAPQRLFFVDNTRGFGHRDELRLDR